MDDFSADDFQSLCVKINSVLKEQNIMQHPMSDFKQQADPQEVATRYTRGYQAWLADDYTAASSDFSWLTLCCPSEPRFHLALAAAMQMQQEYALALSAYAAALLLDANDPEPVYQMAVCLLALDKGADAREALQTAIEMSYLNPEYASTATKANRLLNEI